MEGRVEVEFLKPAKFPFFSLGGGGKGGDYATCLFSDETCGLVLCRKKRFIKLLCRVSYSQRYSVSYVYSNYTHLGSWP